MTVGPAGTATTNFPPQSYGDVAPGQVMDFREAVNRSTISSHASTLQASPGNQTTEHSQDTSRSFPFVLATRPPVNLGNPIGDPVGKQGAPLYDTQDVRKPGEETKASPPLATPKYETHGIVAKLDPEYDEAKWDNDEGNRKIQVKNPTNDPRLANLARSAAHEARLQDGMDGAKTDMMVQGGDKKNYQMSVRYSGSNTSVEFTPMTRESDGKDFDAMKKEMEAKGITVGKGFSSQNRDELAAVYDGFKTLKGKDLDAMYGVTLEKGTRKELNGTKENEAAEYGNKKITFFKEAFEPTMVGNLPKAGATLLHEVGHRFEEVTVGSLGKFQQTKGSTADITPYDAASKTLSQQTAGQSVKVDPRKEHYAEAYMLYKSDPDFMQQNYPDLHKFFEAQTK